MGCRKGLDRFAKVLTLSMVNPTVFLSNQGLCDPELATIKEKKFDFVQINN
jgi:hypothetical protein